MSNNNGKHHNIKIMRPDDVDAIIEKIDLTQESVLIITIPENLQPEIMRSIYEQFTTIATQWGAKLGFDEPISFVICTVGGVVLTLNEKNPYVTIKELKSKYVELLELYSATRSGNSVWLSDDTAVAVRQEKMQEVEAIISFTMLDDISEGTLTLREAARDIERPTWNKETEQYEFWSGIKAYANGGIIGLAPPKDGVQFAICEGFDGGFLPETDREGHGFTNAEKIAVADMMIDRWKVYRNTHMELYADWLADQPREAQLRSLRIISRSDVL